MKKLLITIILLFAVVSILWLGASWLIGVKTEESVRQVFSPSEIASISASPAFPSHTLIDYQRTLFNATAITRMDVRNTPFGAWVDELQFHHRIEHGPLLWEGELNVADLVAFKHEKLLPALSRWQTRLVVDGLDEGIQQWVETAFSGEALFSATSLINYEQTIDYQAHLSPFENVMDEDSQLRLAGVSFSGQFDLQASKALMLNMSTALLEITHDSGRLSFPDLSVQAQVDEVQGAHAFEFSAPQTSLEIAGEPEPITFAMQGKAEYRRSGEYLDGELALTLKNFVGMQYPLTNIGVDMGFNGVNVEGLYAVNELHNRRQDLLAQLSWNAEEIEMPEARRDEVQLELAISETTSQLWQGILAKALQKGQSKLQYVLSIDTELGDLSQQADLLYRGVDHSVTPEAPADYDLDDWLSLLRGDIKLDMAQAVVPADWQSWLAYPIERRSLLDKDGRYQMDSRLTGYDVELNERVVAFDKLAGRFVRPLPGDNESNNRAITPEILALIAAKGLTSDVLQQLEDSTELSADMLDTLRQWQTMNEQLE